MQVTRIRGNGGHAQAATGYRRIAAGEILQLHPCGGEIALECAGPSIFGAFGARLELSIERRALVLDDEVCVTARPERRLRARLRKWSRGTALVICFPADAVARLVGQDNDSRLVEHLRPHARSTGHLLRLIARQVEAGLADPGWYEEQAYFLLGRLLEAKPGAAQLSQPATPARGAARRALRERLGRVTDLIHSAYERPLSLADFAAAASLSTFHLLRAFKRLHGVTPYEFLQRRRLGAGLRLLRTTDDSVRDIAGRVGFADRRSFCRLAVREYGLRPRSLRDSAAQEKAAVPVDRRQLTRNVRERTS